MTIKLFFRMLRSCKSWDWALPRRENGMRLEGILTSCCFSSLYLGRRDAITLRFRIRVMRLGRPLLLPLFLFFSSSFSFFPSFFFLCFVLTLLPIKSARRTSKVVKKFCSQSHDPFSQSWGYWSTDEETLKRTRVNRRQKGYIRESNTEL